MTRSQILAELKSRYEATVGSVLSRVREEDLPTAYEILLEGLSANTEAICNSLDCSSVEIDD